MLLDWNLFDDFDAKAFQAEDFARVVGKEPDAGETKIGQNLRTDSRLVL